MKKIFFVNLILSITLLGCSSKNNDNHVEKKQITTEVSTKEMVTTLVAESNSCKISPKTLNLFDGSYHLKEENTLLEPGMKIAFLKCENGKFKYGDDGVGAIVVYTKGSPLLSKDVLIRGDWGGWSLYSFDGKGK